MYSCNFCNSKQHFSSSFIDLLMFPYQFSTLFKDSLYSTHNLYNLVIECCIVHIYVYLKDLYSKDYVLDLNYILIHLYLNVLR